jgi:DNA end-binding protein Ku
MTVRVRDHMSRQKAASGQKEMLMPIAGKKPANEASAKKPSRQQRKSA